MHLLIRKTIIKWRVWYPVRRINASSVRCFVRTCVSHTSGVCHTKKYVQSFSEINTGFPRSLLPPKRELHTNWMMVSLFFFTWWHTSPPLRFKYKTPSSKYRRLLAFPALYTCFLTCWQTPDLLLQPWKEENHYTVSLNILGSRVGAVVRAPASHHVARVRFRPGAMCRLSLWLFLALFWRFFFGFSGFPPSTKINTPNSNLTTIADVASSINIIILFIYFRFLC